MSGTTYRANATKTTPSLIRMITVSVLLLLAIEYLIGMVVNLYVQIPSAHPGAGAAEYFSGAVQGVAWGLVQGPWALVIHVIIGLLLGLASFILIGLAIASRQRLWIISSLLGWIGIVGAGFNGASFLNYGHDFSSLLMSIGFLLAAISYIIGYFYSR